MYSMWLDAWTYLTTHPAAFYRALSTHIALAATALSIAVLIAVPAGVLLARYARAALIAINAANVGRTLPSLAVLAMMMPLLGTGFVPSVVALTLLALPAIMINTYAGMRQVDADVIDAARGMGMSRTEITRKIELPIALPVIFAGVRTAAVQVVSGAVLASFIGGGGLGDFITAGIAMMALQQTLVGAVPVTLLSLATDFLFGRLQRALTPRGLNA